MQLICLNRLGWIWVSSAKLHEQIAYTTYINGFHVVASRCQRI